VITKPGNRSSALATYFVAFAAFAAALTFLNIGCIEAHQSSGGTASSSNDIVARVNGESVRADEVLENLLPSPPKIGTAYQVDPRRNALDEAIQTRLFAQEARRRGIEVSGLPPAVARAYLAQKLIAEEVGRRRIDARSIDDGQAHRFYEKHSHLFTEVESVALEAIVVEDPELANQLLFQVEGADEKTFDKLAREFSVDQALKHRGNLLALLKASAPDDGVEDEVARVGWTMTKPGQVGLARSSHNRYYVLRANEIESSVRPWDEDLALMAKNVMANELKEKTLEELEEQLRAEAEITVDSQGATAHTSTIRAFAERRTEVNMLRMLTGFTTGTVLGAALYTVSGELSLGFLFADFSGPGSWLLFLLALVSWAAAFGVGALAARIAGSLEAPIALLSVLTGTTVAQVLANGGSLGGGSFLPGLVYGLFALFGGALLYARRQERLRRARNDPASQP